MKNDQQNFSLLFVDDEPPLLRLLQETFAEENYNIHMACGGQDALSLLEKVKVDAVLTDLVMPEMNGLELLKKMKERFPAIMVIMLTGQGGIKDAVKAIQLGADDFLEKPFSQDGLRIRVAQLFKIWELKQKNQKLRRKIRKHFDFPELVGESTPVLRLKEMIAQVGSTESTILIQGETGTGKELVARAIHHHSSRSRKSFIPVDCGAISDTVIQSELFGHVKGAFTGAHTSTLGLIRTAENGTLFLDEVGDLSPTIQVKLLRTLQEKEVRPVGSSRRYAVDARVLAATNRNLAEEVADGRFREDLFYRLNVLTINVPPLRDRKEDIPLLAKHFLQRFATETSAVRDLSPEARLCLEKYDWPGNVRELENVISRAVALGVKDSILPDDLPRIFFAPTHHLSAKNSHPLDDSLIAYEIAAICNALGKSANNRPRAARILGVGEATLYRKIKKYHLQKQGLS